jgi:hypothetical protein
LSPLPPITDPVVINGFSQPGFETTPLIQLNGTSANGHGLQLNAGNSIIRGLVINRFGGAGIVASAGSLSTIDGNYIGVDPTGTVDLGNGQEGIVVNGATSTFIGGAGIARNVISGNAAAGIRLTGAATTGTVVHGNYIGTDTSGSAAIPNLRGILVENGVGGSFIGLGSADARNVISGNANEGVLILANGENGNFLFGNYIGTNANGSAAVPNGYHGVTLIGSQGTVIGGSAAAHTNVISGNASNGIALYAGSTGNLITGNLIGTNAAGTAAIPNLLDGVAFIGSPDNLLGGSTLASRNVISGNGRMGVGFFEGATFNLVEGNFIGTDITGTVAIGNTADGVFFGTNGPSNNQVGGAFAGQGNVIGFNGSNGVNALSGVGNAVRGNSISGNTLSGINLGAPPNDPGDADVGPNDLQNYPVITSAVTNGDVTTVQGTLNSTPNTAFRIDLYGNTVCDGSGRGEGQVFAGTADVVTDGSGDAAFSAQIAAATIVTATATDSSGNTSEFSACVTASGGGGGSVAQIALAEFSGSEQVETYSPNFGRLNSPVTFNGITYTSPGGQLWSDITWANNGYYASWPTASGGTALNDLVGQSNLQIDFSTPVNRVGVLVAPSPSTYIMTAYDDNLVSLGSVSVTLPAESVAAGFLGLQSMTNIRRVVISEPSDNGSITVYEDLRYEAVQGLLAAPAPKNPPKKKKGGV